MLNFMRPVCIASLVGLSACGGGETSPDSVVLNVVQPSLPVGDRVDLSDTSLSSPQTVGYLGTTGEAIADFTPSTQTARLAGSSTTVLNQDVNAGLTDVHILNGQEIVFNPATGSIRGGSIAYSGKGLIAVRDIGESAVFEGVSDVRLSLVLTGGDGGQIDFLNFAGTKQQGVTPPQATSGQRIRIEGITANVDGISGGTVISGDTFTDVDFSDADFDIEGVFTGADFTQAGGILSITAAGGNVAAAFAGTLD